MTSSYDGGGPWCVNPWSSGKDNGGKTARGVTATQAHVVAYVPNEQMMSAPGETKPINLASRQQPALADVVRDWQAAYDHAVETNGTYQLWGRTPVIEIVEASGSDEAAQRADAVEVIAKEPFMVVDTTKTTTGGAPGVLDRRWPPEDHRGERVDGRGERRRHRRRTAGPLVRIRAVRQR